ncbi:histidine phosphatase family protein [Streptomyces sp. NPDC048258]|uniref:histidine phosphatase family protein n=1 Tax=Streptomyces sp. NPDC048258 TaxID=3365527 RepID=UPI0037227E6C
MRTTAQRYSSPGSGRSPSTAPPGRIRRSHCSTGERRRAAGHLGTHECDYGDLNGCPVTALAAERSRHIDVPFPNGQSYRQVIAATADFLHELATDRHGQRVLVIAHSANKWALDCLLTGASIEDLVDAPFGWREGWHYTLPAAWPAITHS